MPGQPRRRLRAQADRSARRAAELKAAGDPGADKAAEIAAHLSALADLAYEKGELPPMPASAEPSSGDRPAALPGPKKVKRERNLAAMRLVGHAAIDAKRICEDSPVTVEAGALAAEIAVSGVRRSFLSVEPPGEPEPLTDGEFTVARAVVVTAAGDADPALTDGTLTRPRWLAAAFPVLNPDERVRCARFLAHMAAGAAESPVAGGDGATVAERALEAAGMSYTSFESARSRETQFDTAQATVCAARKRAVMNLLEETLWRRAFEGQDDETLTRDGDVVKVRKHDNNLAFNLLKYGHDQYARQMVKDKAAANAMTLMISNGTLPEMPRLKEPKAAEAIEAEEVKRI